MNDEDAARAYHLVRVEGHSYRTVAKMMGETLARVRSAVTREAVRVGTPTFAARVAASAAAPAPAPEDGTRDDGFLSALGIAPPADRLHVAPPDDEDDELDVDAETIIRRQIKKVERTINDLNNTDRVVEAQKHTRTLAQLIHDLRQIEKAKRDDAGVLTYSLADADAAILRLDARAASVADQPLVCAECGRAMRRAGAERDT